MPAASDTIITRMHSMSKNMSKWCLYILKCGDGTLYTGITNDLERRLKQHNDGSASRYTRSRFPVKLVYQEPCRGHSHALKKEFSVKSLTRKEKEDYIKQKNSVATKALKHKEDH
jgi:predicted GIY-YIG superfamily endonuclease